MAKRKNNLDKVLQDADELESFMYALLSALDERKLRPGDDVARYAKELKLKIPEALHGAEITWEGDRHDVPAKRAAPKSLVFVRPGHPEAVGLVIKCVRVGKTRICLECGWLWCRIVVTRRF